MILVDDPYNINLYLARAEVLKKLGYQDLCAGDAYKALLLIDEIEDETAEYHEQAVTAFTSSEWHKTSSVEHLKDQLLPEVFGKLVTSLVECGDLQAAQDYFYQATRRLPTDKTHGLSSLMAECKGSDTSGRGCAPRVVYPWNDYEPNRFGLGYLIRLNKDLAQVAPSCLIKPTTLTSLRDEPSEVMQLGMFAKEDIPSGSTFLIERSLLTAQIDSERGKCDACLTELPETLESNGVLACKDCGDTFFCSHECLDLASRYYHPALCGTDMSTFAENIPPKELADALYFLLLTRVFAMADTRSEHPLDLRETKSLWGDFESPLGDTHARSTLPFSFKYNILLPLNALEKMNVDIYATTHLYDFWVIETLYAKFRGVASATANPRTGKPEACAVHPLWCLANHSCAPNVRWASEGVMRLWVRSDDELVKGERSSTDQQHGGINKGEEILNHYCDIDLPVKERREWMRGSLGGDCVCARCVREAGEDH